MATITGTHEGDFLSGTSNNDVFNSGNGDDTVNGDSGNDILNGGAGADILDGGSGSDQLSGGSGSDTLIYKLAENVGAIDIYSGGTGIDTVRLELTTAEWLSPVVQQEVARYVQHLATVKTNATTGEVSNSSASNFTFNFGNGSMLTVSMMEHLEVSVNDVVIDVHAPTIVAADDNGAVMEDATALLLTDSGTINFFDTDWSEGHTVSVAAGTDNALGGMLTATVTNSAAGDGAGVVAWSYQLNNSEPKVQALAAGQSAMESFNIIIADASGKTTTQLVRITITGNNDAVKITSSAQTGAVVEDASATPDTTDALVVAGTISFTDDDLSDGHEVSFVAAAGNATALGAFVLDSVSEEANAAGGTVGWRYTLDNATAQHLAAGEQVTETYTVMVDDKNGSTATQNVVITITGTNDVPDLSVGSSDSAAAMLAENNGGLVASGRLTVTDVDANDTVTVAVDALAVDGTGVISMPAGLDNAALMGMLSLDGAVANAAAAGSAGNLDWHFNSGTEAFDWLGQGETVVLRYTLKGTDSSSDPAADTQMVTITITGSNDAPVLAVSGGTLAYTESQAPAVIDGGLVLSDVDNTQMASARVNIATGFTAGDELAVGMNLSATGITATYDSTTGQLSLSGLASKAVYEAALRSVTYYSSSDDPTLNGTNACRSISWSVTDAGSNGTDGAASTPTSSTINVTAVDSPLQDINLSSLPSSAGFRINGISFFDSAGISVSDAGDVNGDGYDDVIIGADGAGTAGTAPPGQSYVVFGKAGGFGDINLSSLPSSDGFRINGIADFDRSGVSVSSAGDVNGDGYDDVIIGAYLADTNGVQGTGQSYVVFGKAGGFGDLDLSSLPSSEGFKINGIANLDTSGTSVSSAGDVNGDGYDDVIIGADGVDVNGVDNAGQSYVVFGKAGGFGDINLSSLPSSDGFKINGNETDRVSGISVSNAGDMNGDGYGDVVIGAYFGDPIGASFFSGQSYVVFGKADGFGDINLSSLPSSAGFKINGIAIDNYYGISVSSAGDINGDGYDDVIIGSGGVGVNGIALAGQSYVVFGKADGFGDIDLSSLPSSDGFRINGIATYDRSGASVSGAGDINGDGYDDVVIGAYNADPNGVHDAGQSYVVFGKAGDFSDINLSSLPSSAGFKINGIAVSDHSGNSVSGAGDVNGDGYDDVIIGAFEANANGVNDAGQSYVLFGSAAGAQGGNTNDTLTGTAQDEVLVGGLGDDILDGAGGIDALRGGAGNDTFVFDELDRRVDGGSGSDVLRFDSANQVLDLTIVANNKLTGIEVIDLTGTGNNTLTLNVADLLDLSDSTNTLYVNGNEGDTVNLAGPGWNAAGQATVGGVLYDQYTNGAGTLFVAASVYDYL